MIVAAKIALAPLLLAQGVWTRRRVPVLGAAAGARSGALGNGPLLRLLIVGDSSAAGVGVARQRQALAGHLPRALAAAAGVRVRWTLVARSGITTGGLLDLLQDARPARCDIAVVVTGVNDVIEQVPVARALRHRDALADWLREHAQARHVVFAPLPPVQQFPALPQPLRWIAGADARRHDRALSRWTATRDDVSHVPIDVALARANMASDGFHPGEPVYRICGEALAQHIARHWRRP